MRADKVLLGKGGKTRNIRVPDATVLTELDLSRPFVYLPEQQARQWKDCLEWYVRQACDALDIQRRGMPGFRELAVCPGHNPRRTEVAYAYVPRPRDR